MLKYQIVELFSTFCKKFHFLELHYIYILLLALISSGLFYCHPNTNWAYIDALFMATTASTTTGINTIPMSTLTTYHMVILMLAAFFSSHVTISFIVIMVRRYYFSKRFEMELLVNKQRKEDYKRQKQLQQQMMMEGNENDSHQLGRRLSVKSIKRRMSSLSVRSTPENTSPSKSAWSSLLFRNNSKKKRKSHSLNVSSPSLLPSSESQHIACSYSSSPTPFSPSPHHPQPSSLPPPPSLSLPSPLPPNRKQEEQEMGKKVEEDKDRNQLKNLVIDIEYDPLLLNCDISLPSQSHSAPEKIQQQQQQQQITFTPETNILREKERLKLAQQRETALDDDNPILRAPTDKKELTRHERYRIGGTEYRALNLLARLVPFYYIGFLIVMSMLMRLYIACSEHARHVLATTNNEPINPWFFSVMTTLTAFTNLGLIPLDDSLASFKTSTVPLLLVTILILVGNTAYAILLRFMIWIGYHLSKGDVLRKEAFRYLLDHPRRCYTTLFPATQTWWLLFVLIGITFVEWVSFVFLNYWLPVLQDIPWGYRFMDGLLQSVATRNAGLSVVSNADLNPGTQLVYIVAMYISVYPVAISMRHSNIYQEKSLGIFRGEDDDDDSDDDDDDDNEKGMKGGMRRRKHGFSDKELQRVPFLKLKRHSTLTSIVSTSKKVLRGPDFFVVTQIQRQLTSDICWVITGIFLISVLEAGAIMSPSPITLASVIFECVSAFGNVGSSFGYPNTNAAQCAQYRGLSKFVLIVLMYKGRHRGLPASIDRSILLPSDTLEHENRTPSVSDLFVQK